MAFIKLSGLDLFLPNIDSFGPWSGDILLKGNPRVIFIASYSKSVLIGVKTWSWYMPTITSKSFLFFFKKAVSADRGPVMLYFDFLKYLIIGLIIFSSSLNLSIVLDTSPNISFVFFIY